MGSHGPCFGRGHLRILTWAQGVCRVGDMTKEEMDQILYDARVEAWEQGAEALMDYLGWNHPMPPHPFTLGETPIYKRLMM